LTNFSLARQRLDCHCAESGAAVHGPVRSRADGSYPPSSRSASARRLRNQRRPPPRCLPQRESTSGTQDFEWWGRGLVRADSECSPAPSTGQQDQNREPRQGISAEGSHRALTDRGAGSSEQQPPRSSSRAFTSSRNPSWLPATHLLVPSRRMTSAARLSFGSMASMSLVKRSPSVRLKSWLAVKTQWLEGGDSQMHFRPLT